MRRQGGQGGQRQGGGGLHLEVSLQSFQIHALLRSAPWNLTLECHLNKADSYTLNLLASTPHVFSNFGVCHNVQ